MIRAALVAWLLLSSPAWAAPLPDYDTCAWVWQPSSYNVYQQTTPTGPAVKVGSVVIPATGPLTFPCPTEKGTYYISLSLVDIQGREGPRDVPTGITIKGGTPPPVFVVGGGITVKATLLNVRALPGGAIRGTQKHGAAARVLDGPVVLTTPPQFAGTWWHLDYPTGVDGWCLETLLVPTL